MANTTFNGPVRSENGFTVVSKNSSTGAITTSFTLDGSGMQVTPVSLADAALPTDESGDTSPRPTRLRLAHRLRVGDHSYRRRAGWTSG